MSYVKVILQAMRFDHEYTPDEISAITHIRTEDVSRALKVLVSGGVIEQTKSDRLVKHRKFKSKQRQLKL